MGHVEKEKTTTLFILCVYAELFFPFFVPQGTKDIGSPSAASWSGTEFIVHYRAKQEPTNAKQKNFFQSGWFCFLGCVHIYCICGLCHPANSELDSGSTVENVCTLRSLEQKFVSGNLKYLQSLWCHRKTELLEALTRQDEHKNYLFL